MGIVVAVDTTNVTHDGQRYHIARGTAWDADDPLVKSHPGCFTTDTRYVHRTTPAEQPIERATARPGEKRTTRRR